MVGVNTEGTGRRAFAGAGYTSGGKHLRHSAGIQPKKARNTRRTSCARSCTTTPCSSAFAPAEEPKIALARLVENGGFGAQSAAPIARMVLDYYLARQTPDGAAPEDETEDEDD